MCSMPCPEIPIAVRVGTGSEALLTEYSEEKIYKISLSPFPLPGYQNRHISNVERKLDWNKEVKAKN